jgi:probable HAF family extracellular repeat protein
MPRNRSIYCTILLSALATCLISSPAWAAPSAGSLVPWGDNSFGQMNVPAGNDFVAIAAGYEYSLALKSDGSLVGWGLNNSGQTNVPAGNHITAIAAGRFHSLALKSDGSLAGWGGNDYGQANVPAGNDFVAIGAGEQNSLALKSDGSLTGWGSDFYGETSNVPAGSDFVAIAAGQLHSLALKSDGSLVSWGADAYEVTTVPAGNDFAAIAAGYYHSFALKSDGSLAGWGYNGYGQTNVPAGNDFVAIAAGWFHSLALKSDGSLAGWGYNGYEQANVSAGKDFVAIAGGAYHSLAIQQVVPEPASLALAVLGVTALAVRRSRRIAGLLSLCCALSFTAAAQAAVVYTVTDLGTLGGPYSYGLGINASGQVTGYSYTAGYAAAGAFLWTPTSPNGASGMMHDLGTLGGIDSIGTGINDSGQVTGFANTSGDAANHAFLWTPTTPNGDSGTMHDLETLGGTDSYAQGINAAGQVAGYSQTTGDAATHAFLYDPGAPGLHDLGTLGGTSSYGLRINASGQVTGYSYTTGDSDYHAFLYDPGAPGLHDLGTLGGTNSVGSGINASGQVTGNSQTTGDAATHAFLYDPGAPGLLDLGTLGGGDSYGNGINASGQVVGQRVYGNILIHAFLYTSDSGMVDLNSLIDPLSGWELDTAIAINDAGQITGIGIHGNEYHAFLLTPVPEPSTLALLALGLPLLGWRNSRRSHALSAYFCAFLVPAA